MKRNILCQICLTLLFALGVKAQTDTSSYFPLGLWGIWIDHTHAPFNFTSPYTPIPLSTNQWNTEKNNWSGINGNYMVAWLPVWLEDTVMTITEPLGYKLDIARSTLGQQAMTDTSLRGWIGQSPSYSWSYWTSQADSKINGIKSLFGTRTGFYSYFVAHEDDFWAYNWQDTSFWPAIRYAIDKIKSIDSSHKSYVVHWGSRGNPPFPYNVTLSQFAQKFPNLGIYEVDDYVFYNERIGGVYQAFSHQYTDQQNRLDLLLTSYQDCMSAFRNGKTEWHAVIQAQRSYVNSSDSINYARPNLYEMKVQAYLALSRGAKGITSFVYGSARSVPPVAPAVPKTNILSSNASILASDVWYYDGLVDPDRNGFTQLLDQDHDHIPAFDNLSLVYNEIKPLGSVIRKLRVYDAFPHGSIPTSNIAHIVPSSVTSSYGSPRIEFGTFKRVDQGTDSSLYFMVVNRVCNNSDGSDSPTQTITFKVNGSSIGGPYYIQDQRTKSNILYTAYYPGNKYSKFTIYLQPGEGNLFWLYPYAAPSAPQSVALANVNNHPRITWSSNPERNIDHYYIYRDLGVGYSEIASVSSSTTTYTDNDVIIGTPGRFSPYATYYVTAVNSVNLESPESHFVSTQYTSIQKGYAVPTELPKEIPKEFNLAQNYPNPFNPTTSISYALPEDAVVRLTVSDNLGRDVATLVNDYKEAGYYQASFDASRLSSGIYFCKIEAGKFKAVKKMLLMK